MSERLVLRHVPDEGPAENVTITLPGGRRFVVTLLPGQELVAVPKAGAVSTTSAISWIELPPPPSA